MATTTARRRSTHPMSYYWSVVKDMLDEAERDFEAGLGIDDDDLLKEDEEQYERELAEERRLQLETV